MVERAREVGAIPLHEQREPLVCSEYTPQRQIMVTPTHVPGESIAKLHITGVDDAQLQNKLAIDAAKTTMRCFRLLNRRGICTYYKEPVSGSKTEFYAETYRELPFYCSVRRVANNRPFSFPTQPTQPVEVALFLDYPHAVTPIRFENDGTTVLLPPKRRHQRRVGNAIHFERLEQMARYQEKARQISSIAQKAFGHLSVAFGNQGAILHEIQLKFGIVIGSNNRPELGIVGALDNESLAIELPKHDYVRNQRLTDLYDTPSTNDIRNIMADYQQLAKLTEKFS